VGEYSARQTEEGDAEDLRWKAARARKTEADAQLAEIEVSRLKGALVAKNDVVAAWSGFLKVATSRLFGIPTKAGAQLAQETDKAVIEDYLENALREAVQEIMEYEPHIDPTGRSVMAAVELDTVESGSVVKRDRRTPAVKKNGEPAKKRGPKPGSRNKNPGNKGGRRPRKVKV
jgi:hypothetical protein